MDTPHIGASCIYKSEWYIQVMMYIPFYQFKSFRISSGISDIEQFSGICVGQKNSYPVDTRRRVSTRALSRFQKHA